MKALLRRIEIKIRRMMKKTWVKWILGLMLFFFVLGVGFILFHIFKAPKLDEIDVQPEGYVTTIYDRNAQVTKHLSVTESNRIYVPLEDIPKNLQNAFIAIEDKRFYEHKGMDVKGIARAAWIGVSSGFRFTQGGSTLTQQLLKNNVFTGWTEEQKFYDKVSRKIQELHLAVKIEKEYSKEWILENYLNTINLGSGTRGVQVAAQYYYGKNVSDLTLAQCALIAGITKNPAAYNPVKNPEKSVERQQLVLKAMLDQGYISKEEYEDAAIENVITKLITDPTDNRIHTFSWFEEALLKQIVSDLTREYTYNDDEAWDLIYSGGLKIYSTMDARLQKTCEKIVLDKTWYGGNEEVSVVLNDVSTGAVAAIVGGREEKTSNLVYNRATDSIRQPGSTIKVIGEYAAAVDTGELTLGSVLDDEPYSYSDGTAIHNSYGEYRGMTTLRDAIASSSNIVALKAFQLMGKDVVYEYLQKFGITTLTEEDLNEALAIGGTYHGVTNQELTGAYNAIANDGNYVEPFYYTSVVDRKGKVILERGKDYEQIISKETAELLTSAMETVIASGTGKAAAVEGLSLAGKSGTTNENKDVWFVGFSPYYTCGVWGGYDDYSAQKSGNYVKLIWREIMEEIHDEKENTPLVEKGTLKVEKICKKCGKTALKGVCDVTVQGDMTIKEYFVEGTEPAEICDCHVTATICQSSEMIAGKYCPSSSKVENIYLKTATEGTKDCQYVLPVTEDQICNIHTDFWDTIIPEKEEQKDEQVESEEQLKEENWLDQVIDGIFGRRSE